MVVVVKSPDYPKSVCDDFLLERTLEFPRKITHWETMLMTEIFYALLRKLMS